MSYIKDIYTLEYLKWDKTTLRNNYYIICPRCILVWHSGAYHFIEMDDDAGLINLICKANNPPKIYMELIVSNFIDLMVLSHFKSSKV